MKKLKIENWTSRIQDRNKWKLYVEKYNRPNLKVGNVNSTQGILRVVVAGNVKCLPTR
jgi:hypothetical protein